MEFDSSRGLASPETEVINDDNWDQPVESFKDMKLNENLLRGIFAYGFENSKPSFCASQDMMSLHNHSQELERRGATSSPSCRELM